MLDFTGATSTRSRATRVLAMALWFGFFACAPKVQIEPPREPIVIDLNVKIEHEIRVKVDNELDQLFENDNELF